MPEITPLDIVFAMPHPDDIEITCGGTIARLVRDGYRVGMLHLTNGEPTPLGTPETRAAECAQAGRILGATHVETLDLPNRVLMDCPEHRFRIATFLRRHRPRIVATLAGRTPGASPDHYQTQLLMEAARFYAQLTKWDERFDGTPPHRIDWLWYRPAAMAAELPLYAGAFVVDTTDTFETKLAAIAAYASQFPADRFARLRHRVAAWDAADGGRAGFDYGELFMLPHPVPMPDPVGHFQSFRAPPPPPTVPQAPPRA